MIIDIEGKLLDCYDTRNGVIIKHPPFSICLEYTPEQKKQFGEIFALKKELSDTDFKAIKFSDGAYTEEEYAPIRARRAECRRRINEIEETFNPPTLTEFEIAKAINNFYKKYPDARR